MVPLKDVTVSSPRPLPVILLADVSGSMAEHGKIEALNLAVADMIAAFAEEDPRVADIQVAIVAIGYGTAELHQALRSAGDVTWQDMKAGGKTPMGAAFELAHNMLEDRQQIPGRAYAPTLVLVSDGIPTDEWEPSLEKLIGSDRASKAARLAIAIGDDADREMLKKFLGDSPYELFSADQAQDIRDCLRLVTMSVTSRSRSRNPNSIEPTDFDRLEF